MKPVLLCLHGWGGSKESFRELRAALKGKKFEILTPDLPGFGKEPDPKKPFANDDYADWVENWLRKKLRVTGSGFREPILLLGHSHGGRIAMKMVIRKKIPIRHLYLCASAGIHHPRHWKRILGLTLSKTGRVLFRVPGLRRLAPLGRKLLYRLIRVHDYERASPLMQQTMIEVTREDFRPLLPKIKVPTDIFWGEQDRMTKVKDGKLMHKRIRGSRLHLYKGTRHAVHRERAGEIAQIVLQST